VFSELASPSSKKGGDKTPQIHFNGMLALTCMKEIRRLQLVSKIIAVKRCQ